MASVLGPPHYWYQIPDRLGPWPANNPKYRQPLQPQVLRHLHGVNHAPMPRQNRSNSRRSRRREEQENSEVIEQIQSEEVIKDEAANAHRHDLAPRAPGQPAMRNPDFRRPPREQRRRVAFEQAQEEPDEIADLTRRYRQELANAPDGFYEMVNTLAFAAIRAGTQRPWPWFPEPIVGRPPSDPARPDWTTRTQPAPIDQPANLDQLMEFYRGYISQTTPELRSIVNEFIAAAVAQGQRIRPLNLDPQPIISGNPVNPSLRQEEADRILAKRIQAEWNAANPERFSPPQQDQPQEPSSPSSSSSSSSQTLDSPSLPGGDARALRQWRNRASSVSSTASSLPPARPPANGDRWERHGLDHSAQHKPLSHLASQPAPVRNARTPESISLEQFLGLFRAARQCATCSTIIPAHRSHGGLVALGSLLHVVCPMSNDVVVRP